MSYVFGPPRLWGRPVDIPAVAGFSLACAGAGMLAIEVAVRGWWGFVTSPVDLIVVLGLLALSAWLSVWAFGRTDGWWRALAVVGIVVSMVALVFLLILLLLWVLDEEPDAFTGDSNRRHRHRRRRSSRRRRRSSW
ncbi:hypothetical protein [Candidatus Poriferisocius sp.]|uniref:hypothetical protein n=1 Tax=Candidatus Poriferisocius sp. TaxID=3101276 RepID=UPI003B027D7F